MSYCFQNFYLYIENYSFSMNRLYFLNNTTFGDLFESISSFYIDEKICPCFNFLISNSGNYFPPKEEETLLKFYNSYGSTYLYVQIKRRNKCICSKIIKEYFPNKKNI